MDKQDKKNFYISKNDKQLGPFTSDEIIHKINSKEISWMDYLYDESKKDWILILEHPNFNTLFTENILNSTKKNNSPENAKTEVGKSTAKINPNAWYVLKDKNNYGPFSMNDVIQMLQAKILFEFDFVWKSGWESWKRVAEVDDFSNHNIKKLLKSDKPEFSEAFFRRKNVRTNYGCSLVVHDNKKVYKGRSIELSSGGAGIYIDSNSFMPGQNLFLHFQPGDGVPPFNAVCVIVSKQYVDKKNESAEESSEYRYGVKFTSINQNVKEKIQEFAQKEKKNKRKVS